MKGETGSVKGEMKSVNFIGKGKCKLSATMVRPLRGKGKCEFIDNFSATMVTSFPSISLCLSVSLSLSLSLSHQKYLTHNIGSASALPIAITQKQLEIEKEIVREASSESDEPLHEPIFRSQSTNQSAKLNISAYL